MGLSEQIWLEDGAFPNSTEPQVAHFLRWLLCMTERKSALEIGTFRGATAACMLEVTPTLTIDVEDQLSPLFREKHADRFILGDSRTHDFGAITFDFIYIDGHHDYEHVVSEFAHLLPHMTKDCIIVFHDTVLFKEVGRAVDLLPIRKLTLPTPRGCGLTIATLL